MLQRKQALIFPRFIWFLGCLATCTGRAFDRQSPWSKRASGISEIAVVVGFEAERIRHACGPEVEYIENPIFAETNSMYSLWLARHFFGHGFVVLNSDVFFHPQLLTDLLTARHEDAILVSYRNGTKYGDEEMKVKMSGGDLLDISKTLDPDEADGGKIGIVKFRKTSTAVGV